MISKNFIVLCLATLFGLSNAFVPSYIEVCGRRNPNLDQCVVDSAIKLLPKLRVGIPELNVPPLEPLEIEELPMANLDSFKASATNVKISGLSNFTIITYNVRLQEQKIYMDVIFPRVQLNADYNVKAKILVSIAEKGPIDMVTENIRAKATLKFRLVERRGRQIMFWEEMTTKVFAKDYTASFGGGGEQKPLAQAINQVLQTSRKEIIESITPSLERALSAKILDISNRISKNFSYEELFPDRE
ncbi:uncharacterized protein LOC106659624 [Trichogramma pretiosum]|uniref:uncharacterized protein LOC106659624 n=1 Tax=Trichogramma pretiosum TaxID=7493 RepID=UPI0006C96BA9|nr:uncharacterized protein LOC106659624 [Trichogramma pretiosum]